MAVQGRAQGGIALQLVEDTPGHKVYEWTSAELSWRTIMVGQESFLTPDSSAVRLLKEPGYPVLPMVTASLRLLPGQSAIVTLSDTLYTWQTLSAPLYIQPAAEGPMAVPSHDPGTCFPKDVFTFQTGISRRERYVQMTLYPLQWRAQSPVVRWLRYARIHVRIENQPAFTPLPRTVQTSLRNPLPSCLKAYTVEEGVYGITGADLTSAGYSLSAIVPATLQLFANGREEPLELLGCEDGRLDPSDQILFWGNARHGEEGGYYHDYSDTMVYWITWGGPPGKRYAEAAFPAQANMTDLFADSLHFEKDVSYYSGDSDSDIHNSEKVSGEGWVWAGISRNGSALFKFDAPAMALEQDSVILRLRIRGTTLDARSPDHHVQILLNDVQSCELWFDDREEKHLRFAVPRQRVRKQDNVLTVRLLGDTPAERSQIYVDWIKIDYLRQTQLHDGAVTVFRPADGQDLFISGFTGLDAHVWDLPAGKKYAFTSLQRAWLSRIEVRSAGYADGDYAHLLREGEVVATGVRGLNLWRINPADGSIAEQRNFDTYTSSAQAESLAAWIGRLPQDAVIAAAIRDEGSVRLSEAARLALESLGSAQARNIGVRDSWALIGKKGLASGSALEAWKTSKSGPAVIATVMYFPEGGRSHAIRVPLPATVASRLAVFEPAAVRRPLRMARYQPGDLRSGGPGADYLIITHPRFVNEARQLADYRAGRNRWRTRVVLVEEIYDEFANGLASPEAIKSFITHAYHNWTQPAPAWLLFFGDASWDPKNHLAVANPGEFVPTYGNPVSDNWFVCVDGVEDILPDLWVGRLPVKTVQEAAASLEKIFAYEEAPSAAWRKDFLFISGGFDFVEQGQFGQQSQHLIRDYVEPAPTCGRGIALHKTSDGYKEGEHRQEILDAINDGVAWVNFIGHAGSRTWDLMFHNVDVDALDNGPRYPFITSMTCHTGRFAEPNQVAFGEYFILAQERGAIGFMGTSGWGYSYEDYSYLRKLFPLALQDTVRHLGELVSRAKVALWRDAADNTHIRDMVYQYNLLGDPAVKLAVPEQPDLCIQPTDILVQPEIPSEADSTARVMISVHNYGLKTSDSVTVRLAVVHPNVGERVLAPALRLAPLGRLDSLRFQWPLKDMAGAPELVTLVDPFDQYTEADEKNNLANRAMLVISGRIQAVTPPPMALISPEKATIKIEDMVIDRSKTKSVEFQLDTLSSFNSPFLQTSDKLTLDDFTLAWTPNLLPFDHTYFWRCRDLSNSGTIYHIGGIFNTTKSSAQGWLQAGFFSGAEGSNVQLGLQVALDHAQTQITVASGGFYDGNFAAIYLNGQNIITGRRGYNIAVLDSGNARLKEIRYFDLFGDGTARQGLISFLNGLSPGDMVLLAVQDDGSFLDDPELIAAFESIGSSKCRRVEFRASWALIGIKGSTVGSAIEKLVSPRSGDAAVLDTISYRAESGTLLSPRIGPASRWISMRADAEIPQNSALSFDVLGLRRNSTVWDTLRTGLTPNTDHDLGAISSQAYPSLRLRASFRSLDRTRSPALLSWRVLHDPVPDLAVSPAFFTLSADSLLSGTPVLLNLELFNIGLAAADSIPVSFSEIVAGSEERIFSRLTLGRPVACDAQVSFSQHYTPTGRPGVRLLTVRIDPENRINELSEANNMLTTRVQVVADTTKPTVAIFFDGRSIINGELVASRPLIEACIIDDSPQAVQDTLLINILIDGQRFPFTTASGAINVTLEATPGKSSLRFTPFFEDGEHTLEIFFADAGGNTNSHTVDFRVVSALQLLQVLNYPNPFIESTTFTFELTQSANVSIRIYTVNGRLIRIIDAGELGAGFNQVPWDGRDAEGDVIANGVYLYRVLARNGEHRHEVLQKAILMR